MEDNNTEKTTAEANFVNSHMKNVSFEERVRKKDMFTISTYTIFVIMLFLQVFMIFALDIFK